MIYSDEPNGQFPDDRIARTFDWKSMSSNNWVKIFETELKAKFV